MRLRWTPAAAQDLEQIHDYLTEHQPEIAQSTIRELYEAVRSLRNSPRRGRLGREGGTRELIHGRLPYIVAYRVAHEDIEILHIFHSARSRE